MVADMASFGWNTSFASLHPNIDNCSPDNPFSDIPYDKGYQLLVYLETLIGEDKMQQFMKSYIVYFHHKSLNWVDFSN
jgi:leukotriene-A4 hydrolase